MNAKLWIIHAEKIFDFEFLFIPTLVELPVWVLKKTSNGSLLGSKDFTQGEAG